VSLEKDYPLTINGIVDPWPGSERKWAQTTVGIWLCQRYLKQSVSPRFQPLGFHRLESTIEELDLKETSSGEILVCFNSCFRVNFVPNI